MNRQYKKSKKKRIQEAEQNVIMAAIQFSKFTGGPVGIFDALRKLALEKK